ncbi:glutaredoxin family protein [Micrococcus sp. 2A]|uniref:glutaredoxin family protein n=1 Tax=Micrococcus sp. 2A TaxID=3142261 RepID=UPI0031BA5B06
MSEETTAMITVYGQPTCYPCKQATAYLDRHQIPYDYVDLTGRPELVTKLKSSGLEQTPILQTPTSTTSGLRLDALQAAVAEYRAADTATTPAPAPHGPAHT